MTTAHVGRLKRALATSPALLLVALAACGGAGEETAGEAPVYTVPENIDYGDYQPACDDPTEVKGFLTCADVDAALEEGQVVLYAPSVEPAQIAILNAFNKTFPEIQGDNVRLQTGALYSRLLQERQAKQYQADVLVLSDMSMLTEFGEERKGYEQYVSPEIYAYPPEFMSDPVGMWQPWGMLSAGISYNPECLEGKDPPETWEDLLDPEWQASISFKKSTSGLQMLQWDVLQEKLGEDYWDKMAAQDPIAFDSYVQQFERLVNCEDLIAGNAQYSGYLEFLEKGAPVEFVIPPAGLPSGPEAFGLVTPRPNEEAGKLFIDWLMSEQGQVVVQDALKYHSVRDGMPAPEGGVSSSEANFQQPEDWDAFTAKRTEFEKVWNTLVGAR